MLALLHRAVAAGMKDIVRILAVHGSNVGMKDIEGKRATQILQVRAIKCDSY